MKRDMDLVREILLQIEAAPKPSQWIEIKVPDRSAEEIAYHVMLLDRASLIEGRDLSTMGDFDWKPIRLTWQGHEFLDAARNDTLWRRAKDKVLTATGGMTVELRRDE